MLTATDHITRLTDLAERKQQADDEREKRRTERKLAKEKKKRQIQEKREERTRKSMAAAAKGRQGQQWRTQSAAAETKGRVGAIATASETTISHIMSARFQGDNAAEAERLAICKGNKRLAMERRQAKKVG